MDLSFAKFKELCRKRRKTRVVEYVYYTTMERGYTITDDMLTRRVQNAIMHQVNKDQSWRAHLNSTDVKPDEWSNDLMLSPPNGVWIPFAPHMRLMIHRKDSSDKHAPTRIKYTLECDAHDADQMLDSFLSEAYNEYMCHRNTDGNKYKYMFVPHLEKSSRIFYEQYKLENQKTFDVIFHREKTTVKQMIDDFVHKRGKYQIAGYPYKLGLLFHGAPGTGKTSMIKAIANYTKRHVITIPLAKLRTNQQLMDLMTSTLLVCGRNEKEYTVSYDKLIYVIEDIDAVSDIVKKRNAKGGSGGGAGSNGKGGELDMLNLAGILNVIDGIVDTPGRILIMTTNHPETLDPALIRPGRINKVIHLDTIDVNDALDMIHHYMGAISDEQRQKIIELFPSAVYTPAFLESKCLDFNDVDDLIVWLKSQYLAKNEAVTDADSVNSYEFPNNLI